MYADNNTCVNETELLALMKTVVECHDQGVVIWKNTTAFNDWDLVHSVYFIATTLTTIGSSCHRMTLNTLQRKQLMDFGTNATFNYNL